jgi:hypothetical protein
MQCISCEKAGNLPNDCGDGSWVRCDAIGGWWHVACVRAWHEVVSLLVRLGLRSVPSDRPQKWVESAAMTTATDEDDAEEA